MNNLLLPPSANWFQHNGVSSRPKDRLFVTSCFKTIVPYRLPENKGFPEALKLISHNTGKVNGVAVFPDPSDSQFGNTVAALGDKCSLVNVNHDEQCMLSLYDMHSGSVLQKYESDKIKLNSLCWGVIREENVVVAVGDKGVVIVWQPKYLAVNLFTLEASKNLTVVEVLPRLKHQALIASGKTILLVSLQDGTVISHLKGHDMPIYCIRLYPGKKNLKELSSLQSNRSWRKDETSNGDNEVKDGSHEEDCGTFFASSDMGRNIFVWDLKAKRFFASLNVPALPLSAKKQQWKERSQSKNNHITLNWYKDKLLTSTVAGEVLEWDIALTSPKFKMVCHPHSRVIYNMEIIADILLTFSQDRLIQAFDLSKSSPFFKVHTVGTCANYMTFSPHDGNRLAIGMQDQSIKIITLNEGIVLKMDSISNNIKGKVLSLSWHPVNETKLLFGTSDGQVGIADVISLRTTSFATFHTKSVYKVEFGPPLAPDITGLSEECCPYSFGDRELLGRCSTNFLQDPVQIEKLLIGVEKGIKNTFCLSEFTFSPCWKYLAIGAVSGDIRLYDRLTLNCVLIISRVKKVIQHLSWKPTLTSHIPYILGVASGENSVYIFDVEKELKEQEGKSNTITITQPTRELCAHTSRTIWLSWSLHEDGLLASASYDHTVQIWDTNTGEPVCNYGGHIHRVFRCEFSPIEPNKVISFAEENCIHEWLPSEQTTRTALESIAVAKENRRRIKPVFSTDSNAQGIENSGDLGTESSAAQSTGRISEKDSIQFKKVVKKSSFPLFHNVLSRKKYFHQMCLLSLLEIKENQNETLADKMEDLLLSEDLEELEDEDSQLQNGNLQPKKRIEYHIENALEKYREFMPIDDELPKIEDLAYFLKFFGSRMEIEEIVNEEIKHHDANDFSSRANLMHCWQGSLEDRIKYAAVHKRLDPILVSFAPQVSFSLWEFACEAYAEQLKEANDLVTAASYLIAIHKVEDAIDLLLKNKHYKEALTIAKNKFGFNEEIINKVLISWANSVSFEGNYELSSLLHFVVGSVENAAKSLSRGKEPRALVIAALLFLHAKCNDLAVSTAVLAFKEASYRNEFSTFKPILKYFPHLEWCKYINICNKSLRDHERLFRKSFPTTVCDSNPLNNEKNSEEPVSLEETVIRTIKSRWNEEGILSSMFRAFSQDINKHLPIQTTPSTVKSLWFLVSVSLTEMLLVGEMSDEDSSSLALWEQHLEKLLQYICIFGKNDLTFYLTHILLPKGVCDLSVFEIPAVKDSQSEAIKRLQFLYILSELKVISSFLENDADYLPWMCEKSGENMSRGRNTEPHASRGVTTLETEPPPVVENVSSGSENLESLPDNNEHVSEIETKDVSSNGKSSQLHLFESKEVFFATIEIYVDFCVKISASEYYSKDCVKYLSEIIARLHCKALVNLEFLNSILSKIGKS